MPVKTKPVSGQSNWGNVLNTHLEQLIPNSGGGINTFDIFTDRPIYKTGTSTPLDADDAGLTYLFTQTGNLHRWSGTQWKVLNESVINVKDYGAVGDGVVDDTVALQLCLNIGGQVFLPKGNFKISDTLIIQQQNGLVFFGTGKSNIIVDGSFNKDMVKFVGTDVIKNIKFKDINFRPSTNTLDIVKILSPIAFLTFDSCSFSMEQPVSTYLFTQGYGIHFANATDYQYNNIINIYNCNFQNLVRGVRISSSAVCCTIQFCIFQTLVKCAILLDDYVSPNGISAMPCLINACNFEVCGIFQTNSGVVEVNTGDVTISNCHFESSGGNNAVNDGNTMIMVKNNTCVRILNNRFWKGFVPIKYSIVAYNNDELEICYNNFQETGPQKIDVSNISVNYLHNKFVPYENGPEFTNGYLHFSSVISSNKIAYFKNGLQTQQTADTAGLSLGEYKIWVDANGMLRMNKGQPSSDLDGSIVGRQ